MFDLSLWRGMWGNNKVFMNGLVVTIEMALVGLLIALVIGVILGLFSTSEKKTLRVISRIYVEFFQNTPLMLQALFLFYSITYSGITGFSPIACGMIALGIYHGAYIAEVVRAGIESIPRGQFESAHSQGFGYAQTMTFIIIPQTIKIV